MVAIQYRNKGKKLNPFKKVMKRKSRKTTIRKKRPVSAPAVRSIVRKELNKEIETKLQPLTTYYGLSPSAQNTGNNIVFYNNYCLGEAANTWVGPAGTGNFSNLLGFEWQEGTAPNQRIGRYMDLKHTTLSFRVGMVGVPRTSAPTRFRIIVYKAKRNARLGTSGGNPNQNLFLNIRGEEKGINTSFSSAASSYEFMNMLVNKRNYEVFHDSQFILSHPTFAVQGGSNIVSPISQGMYPNEKNFLWKLPHNEKIAFDTDANSPGYNRPQDSRYQYCITILSMPTGDLTNTGVNQWKTQVRGVVSCKDA